MAMTELELVQLINSLPNNAKLKKIYSDAYKRLLVDLDKWVDAYPTLTDSQKREFIRKAEIANRLDNVLSEVNGKVQRNIFDTIIKAGKLSHDYNMYRIESKFNLDLGDVLINDKALIALANKPTNGKAFSERLHNDTNKVATATNQAITDGLVQGKSYREIARGVRDLTNMAYNNALRISRTESGRVANVTNYQASKELVEHGFDVKKQWVSTLDMRTRSDHALLDKQEAGVDEYFKVNGNKALHPHGFGIASEDINCRCAIINVIDDVRPETRRDNQSKETIKDMSYAEWLESKTGEKIVKKQSIFSFGGMIKEDKALEYEKLLSNALPEIRSMYENTELTLKSTSNNGTAYYRQGDGVYISKDVSNETFFHEFAHNVDGNTNKLDLKTYASTQASDGLKDYGQKDWANSYKQLKKDMDAEVKKIGLEKFQEKYKGKGIAYKDKEGKINGLYSYRFDYLKKQLDEYPRRAISDWLEGILKIDFPMGTGHGKKYHKYPQATDKEIFAELTSLYINHPDQVEQVRKYFPTLVDRYLEIIKEIAQ